MKNLFLVILLSFLALPFSALADSNTVIFHYRYLSRHFQEINVAYTVCTDSPSGKHGVNSTPCNNPIEQTLSLGHEGHGDAILTIGDDFNHYVSVTQITFAASGKILFSSTPAGAYNGCNTANQNDSLTFLVNGDGSITCLMGKNANK